MIPGPKRPADHPDRDLDCQEMLEVRFQDLAGRAEDAGWTGDEVARALLALAMAHIRARIAQADVERAIRLARDSVGEH